MEKELEISRNIMRTREFKEWLANHLIVQDELPLDFPRLKINMVEAKMRVLSYEKDKALNGYSNYSLNGDRIP